MELILQTGLEHQEKPVNAIAQVFENTPIEQPSQYFENPVFDFHILKIIKRLFVKSKPKRICITHYVKLPMQRTDV